MTRLYRCKCVTRGLLSLLLLLGAISIARAQEFRATIQGSVTDATGGAIPGAQVTLLEVATGVERSTTTNEVGLYTARFLAPGNYTVTITADGFKTSIQEGVNVDVGESRRLDVQLEVGAVTEAIEVSAAAVALETDSVTTGASVDSKITENLPTKGHSPLFMYQVIPGVSTHMPPSGGPDPFDTGGQVWFSANGAPAGYNEVTIDGAVNTVNVDRNVGISSWVPSVDAIQNFRVQTGVMSAEFGRTGGSAMNAVIKSGTNELHGSAFHYLQNSVLNANGFFANAAGDERPKSQYNLFGATIGGPIKRNRAFFFYNYQGVRKNFPINKIHNVATTLMRQGDFSETGRALYNPFSVVDGPGGPTRELFPNALIPESMMDRVGAGLVQYWPEPNQVSPNASRPWVQNYSFVTKTPGTHDSHVVKFDFNLRDDWLSYFRFHNAENRFTGRAINFSESAGNLFEQDRPAWGASLGNTFTLTPTTLLDVKLGFTWGGQEIIPADFDAATLGFQAGYTDLVQFNQFPRFRVTEFVQLGGSSRQLKPGYTWALQPNLTLIRGRHALKLGFDGRLAYGSFFRGGRTAGDFRFTPTWTDGPIATDPSRNTGFSIASMMLGLGSGSLPSLPAFSTLDKYYSFFVQDDWKVTNRLTLNLGLRYEVTPGGRTERYNRATRGFCYECESPINGMVPGLGLRGGLVYVGVDGNPRSIYDTDKNNFGPRLGLAYRINNKTVLRSGYGLYFVPEIGAVEAPGYSVNTPWVTTLDGFTPSDRLSNPFPNGHLPLTGNSEGLATQLGQNISFVEPSDRITEFHTWTLNLQRELAFGGIVEIGYIGSATVNLAQQSGSLDDNVAININQIDPSLLSMGQELRSSVDNPFFGIIGSGPLSGPKIQRQQLMRPFPHFGNIMRIKPAIAHSSYHSLQAKFQRRMAKGLTSLIGYTWGHQINNFNTPQNNWDLSAERADASNDYRHRLTVTAVYDLPFGRGQTYGADIPRALNFVIGGWTLSGNAIFQTGRPAALTTNRNTIFGSGFGAQRPNVVGDPTQGIDGSVQERLDRYFNTDAFAAPANFQLGNAASRIPTIRSHGIRNLNVSLLKEFQVTERVSAEFRASAFNTTNTPVFSPPNTSVGAGSFGRISGTANDPRAFEFMLRLRF